jgi:hypothetical protein
MKQMPRGYGAFYFQAKELRLFRSGYEGFKSLMLPAAFSAKLKFQYWPVLSGNGTMKSIWQWSKCQGIMEHFTLMVRD